MLSTHVVTLGPNSFWNRIWVFYSYWHFHIIFLFHKKIFSVIVHCTKFFDIPLPCISNQSKIRSLISTCYFLIDWNSSRISKSLSQLISHCLRDSTKEGQWLLQVYSTADFAASWLKWLENISNDSKILSIFSQINWSHLNLFEIIWRHLSL